MGWLREDTPGHEGYFVALVWRRDQAGRELPGLYRELAYPLDELERTDVRCVQAGCHCGWRSQSWPIPRGAVRWLPFSAVAFDRYSGDAREFEEHERRALELWETHALLESALELEATP